MHSCIFHSYFNSHPHKEDDDDSCEYFLYLCYFNSHPHKEDDCFSYSTCPYNCISTHILTRRMTFLADLSGYFFNISTHILTRRMTAILNKKIYLKSHIISTINILYLLLTSFFIFIYISKPNFPLFLVRMSQEIYVHLSFALEYQRILNIKTRLSTNMFYFIFIFFTQIIKSQTIYLFVYNVLQYIFYLSAFGCVHLTFKYRILYSLSIISAFFCNLSQPFPSCCSLSIYIICNQN